MYDRPRLLFTTANDLFSVGVRTWTFSPTSHVAIVLGPGGNTLLHALSTGVHCEPRWSFYDRTGQHDVAEFVILPDVSAGLRRLHAEIGRPYDTPEIVARVGLALLRFACPWLPRTITSSRKWSCARFVVQLDPRGERIPEWRGLDEKTVTPADFYDRADGPSFRRLV